MLPLQALQSEFGDIDIYLFDQLLKGRITAGMRVLDAGCGVGRNLHYLLRCGVQVYGLDPKEDAIGELRRRAAELAPDLPGDNFRQVTIENNPFGGESFDFVIANAVLHFARDSDHFAAMVDGLWSAVARPGTLFVRLATSIGIESAVTPVGDHRFRLPDGTTRYLVDAATLHGLTTSLQATALEPLKTVLVEGQRAMTTWVLAKSAP